MKIYIIRHGETEANKRGVLQGWSDYGLNEWGIELAELTGKGMQGIKFDAAFSSPLNRARHTAELILENSGNAGVEMFIDDRLKEICMGDWEDRSFKNGEIPPEQVAAFMTDAKSCPAIPGGESVAQLCERTQAFLKDLADKDYDSVLVSTHGCAVRAMLNFLYEDPSDFWHGNVPYNCVVNIVEAENGEMKLIGDDVIYYDKELIIDRYSDISL